MHTYADIHAVCQRPKSDAIAISTIHTIDHISKNKSRTKKNSGTKKIIVRAMRIFSVSLATFEKKLFLSMAHLVCRRKLKYNQI